jgi:mannose/cellobiose epimerase-like protein (N-acyl-D-glucosamine 2-epimerase family)
VTRSPRADELLSNVDKVIDRYYWDDEFQMMNNSWNQDFTILENYRGINANMHAVEALAAAYDVTGLEKYRDRAYVICKRTVKVFAKNNDWMLPEHFNEKWIVDKNFNFDNPADPFCPFGVTIGHLFEWSRLILQLKIQIEGSGLDDSWIVPGAQKLYGKAKKFGWSADGTDGFVYTVDWDGKPVVRSRMVWVAAEAVMTAYTLGRFTGDSKYLAIAAASILAKVAKDTYVKEWSAASEDNKAVAARYDLLKNKGYGTAKHREGLKAHGADEQHRKQFIRNWL